MIQSTSPVHSAAAGDLLDAPGIGLSFVLCRSHDTLWLHPAGGPLAVKRIVPLTLPPERSNPCPPRDPSSSLA